MKVKGIMNYKESQLNVCDCNIEKVVVLSEQEYRHFRANMGKKYDFIEEIVGNWNIYYGGRWHNAELDGGTAGMTQFVVRKMAHFGSYFLVGMFGFLGLRRIFKLKWVAPVLTWFGAIALAAFDEYHQYLTGDRTPSVHDVMLDASGALCGIVLCIIVIFIRKKLQKK